MPTSLGWPTRQALQEMATALSPPFDFTFYFSSLCSLSSSHPNFFTGSWIGRTRYPSGPLHLLFPLPRKRSLWISLRLTSVSITWLLDLKWSVLSFIPSVPFTWFTFLQVLTYILVIFFYLFFFSIPQIKLHRGMDFYLFYFLLHPQNLEVPG